MRKKNQLNLKGAVEVSTEKIGGKAEIGYENDVELLYKQPDLITVDHFNQALVSFSKFLTQTKSEKKTVFFIDDAEVYSLSVKIYIFFYLEVANFGKKKS